MGKLKIWLQNNTITKRPYYYLKRISDQSIENNLLQFKGTFINRSKNREKLCIILAGYKEFLFEDVFSRIIAFLPKEIDVCVVSSGINSTILSEICKKNEWSYLSTVENNVSLVQNAAINLHPNAQYIYKLDEDIFITEGFFENLMDAYQHAKKGDYNPGVIAPLLLVNGFCTPIILKMLNMVDIFESKFGEIKHIAGEKYKIEKDPEVAKFMWGDGNEIPQIDALNKMFSRNEKEEIACPIRFSIGAILFERTLWENMHYYDVDRKDKYMMGKDEVKLCQYCLIHSQPIMVSKNIVVGHFSFGAQTEGMKEFYGKNRERFMLMR